jgi:hypothetical protein
MKHNDYSGKQKIDEYWKPYLSQFQSYEYNITENITNQSTLMLQSPFISSPYDLTFEELKYFKYIETGLSRKNSFDRLINESSIDSICSALSFVEKNYRTDFLLHHFLTNKNSDKFSDKEIWNLIVDIWSESEFNCLSEKSRNTWKEIFTIRSRPISFIKSLPKKIDVYRGGTKDGFSWTSDIEVAKWFQNRTDLLGVDSYLLKVTVHKNDVLFCRKNESEIVIDPDSLYSLWKFNDIETLEFGNN